MSLSKIDEIMIWNHAIEVERSIIVNSQKVTLNLVPTHIWSNAISKADLRKKAYLIGNWRKYQAELCTKKVSFNKVCYFVTGFIPNSNFQLIVLDIDINSPLRAFDGVFGFQKQLKVFLHLSDPFRIVHTGSGGFHCYYLADRTAEIRNVKHLGLNEFAKAFDWIRKVDIRATGGFVFAPPSQFKGGLQYQTVWANSVHINDANKFLEEKRNV